MFKTRERDILLTFWNDNNKYKDTKIWTPLSHLTNSKFYWVRILVQFPNAKAKKTPFFAAAYKLNAISCLGIKPVLENLRGVMIFFCFSLQTSSRTRLELFRVWNFKVLHLKLSSHIMENMFIFCKTYGRRAIKKFV